MSDLEITDWSEVLISDIISEIQTGVSVNSENRRRGASEIGILKTSCIARGQFFPEEHKAVLADEVERVKTPLKGESILMSRMNTPNLVGEIGYVQHQHPNIYLPDRLWMFRGRTGTSDTRFLSHLLSSDGFRQELGDIATGTSGSMKNIPQRSFLQIPVSLPPLPEQKKIAEILSGIDSTMGNLKSYLAKQEILKKSVVSKLIFNKDNDCRRIGETDCNYCLADVSTRITDGTHQAVKTSKNGTIPFLYISCIKDGIIDWSKSAFISAEQYAIATQGRQPSSGDILYTVVGSYGNAVMVSTSKQFCFQRHIALIQLDQKQVEPKFIEIALCSEEVKKSVDKVVAGNAQPTLTLGELRKLQIPLPSLNMQRRICQIISPLELKISALEKKIEAMKSLKTAMSADLLSGRKRVSI